MFHFTLRTEAQKEDTVETETSHSDMVEANEKLMTENGREN